MDAGSPGGALPAQATSPTCWRRGRRGRRRLGGSLCARLRLRLVRLVLRLLRLVMRLLRLALRLLRPALRLLRLALRLLPLHVLQRLLQLLHLQLKLALLLTPSLLPPAVPPPLAGAAAHVPCKRGKCGVPWGRSRAELGGATQPTTATRWCLAQLQCRL